MTFGADEYTIPNDPTVSPADIQPGADLGGADLSEAILFWADLSGADLGGADLSGADLGGADLSEAILLGADLSEAYLRKADLTEANLARADLTEANLLDADLSEATLSGADLTGTALRQTDLSDVDLSDIDLSDATFLKDAPSTVDQSHSGQEGEAGGADAAEGAHASRGGQPGQPQGRPSQGDAGVPRGAAGGQPQGQPPAQQPQEGYQLAPTQGQPSGTHTRSSGQQPQQSTNSIARLFHSIKDAFLPARTSIALSLPTPGSDFSEIGRVPDNDESTIEGDLNTRLRNSALGLLIISAGTVFASILFEGLALVFNISAVLFLSLGLILYSAYAVQVIANDFREDLHQLPTQSKENPHSSLKDAEPPGRNPPPSQESK